MTDLPPAPSSAEKAEPHCEDCGSLFHAECPTGLRARGATDWPPGYDPSEADQLRREQSG